ncbi:MAG: exopolysaccharide biosynthesis polyprenyl glycosylphosphotransferase [candidate division WOR-3 bacterium]|nr:exopolysaccharide biosynthesis polyprenyl glycosylphosphotransferase [candidate division WOR-3 bacterium]
MSRLQRFVATLVLVLGDAAAVFASYALGYLVRNWFQTGIPYVFPPGLQIHTLTEKAFVLAVYPFVFAYEGLYTKRLVAWEEARRYVRGVIIATAAVMILLFLWRIWIVSRVAVLLALAFSMVLAPATRALLKWILAALRLGRQQLVILGGGPAAEQFCKELTRHRALGYVAGRQIPHSAGTGALESVLAEASSLDAILVVVSDSFTPEEMRVVFKFAERRFAETLVIPTAALLQSTAAEVEQVGSILVMKYRYSLLRPLNTFTKSVLELAGTVPLLVVLTPLFLVLALLVKVSSKGPILFRQKRIGRDRKLFDCLKFRTMYCDAEQRLADMLAGDEQVRAEWLKYARITNDPRVTPIGRLLRRLSLDELPQLWNVLRGEMALVGPRPYLPVESDRIGESLDTIVRVRPGMTGLWQVSGRTSLPFKERLTLDEYYIRNWSLWMDFSIALRTLRAVVSGRGAY